MSEIKWVKLTTDMFDNRKIRYIRKLPEGNNIVLIWVMLLTLAGRCNSGGMIFLTERIPYTTKMLADELCFEESIIVMAVTVLENLEMVTTSEDGVLSVNGWGEHQNIEGMEAAREKARIRSARYRANQKALQQEENGDGQLSLPGMPSDTPISDEAPPKLPPAPSPEPPEQPKVKYSEKFEEFWNEYPLKKDRGAAFKNFCTRINQGEDPDDMILAAKEYAKECKKEKTESKYIKHGSTFLGPTLVFREYLQKAQQKKTAQTASDSTNPFSEYADE